jgi:hypothetical protein
MVWISFLLYRMMAGVGTDTELAAWVASARDNWICRGWRVLNMVGNVGEVYGLRTKGACGGKEGKLGQGHRINRLGKQSIS